MINRTMVRTRVVQTLFAYYTNQGDTPSYALKQLRNSFSDTYSLYMMLLEFVNALTRYAQEQLEASVERAKVVHREFVPNRRFVENRFAKQVFNNLQLRHYIDEQHLTWDAGMNAVEDVYKQLNNHYFFRDYMRQETVTYEDDRRVWRRIMSDIVPESEEMFSALEEMEVVFDKNHWTTDLDIVASYVVKTIKRFKEDSDATQALLPMFDKEEEVQFGEKLLECAIANHDVYAEQVKGRLEHWDAERLAFMDRIILQTALAEILNFPDIALEISMNEYLEIAKEYSSEKSHIFINGVLDEILKGMKQDNVLLK